MTLQQAYSILGIDKTATRQDVKHAYSNLTKNCHMEEQPEAWKHLHEAYRVALSKCSTPDTVISSRSETTTTSPTVFSSTDKYDDLFQDFEEHTDQISVSVAHYRPLVEAVFYNSNPLNVPSQFHEFLKNLYDVCHIPDFWQLLVSIVMEQCEQNPRLSPPVFMHYLKYELPRYKPFMEYKTYRQILAIIHQLEEYEQRKQLEQKMKRITPGEIVFLIILLFFAFITLLIICRDAYYHVQITSTLIAFITLLLISSYGLFMKTIIRKKIAAKTIREKGWD